VVGNHRSRPRQNTGDSSVCKMKGVCRQASQLNRHVCKVCQVQSTLKEMSRLGRGSCAEGGRGVYKQNLPVVDSEAARYESREPTTTR